MRYRLRSSSRGIRCSFRVFCPSQVSPLWVRRSRFAVGPYLGCAVFPDRGPPIVVQAISFILSSSCAFLQSFTQSTLAVRPQPVGSSLGLSFPSAHVRIEDPLFVSLAGTHWGPPSGFGYPRDGLRPSIPGRSCFIPAALLGFPLRSSALTGRPNVIERTGPPTVPPVVAPTTFAVGRPDGLRFLGFAPGESSSRRRVCLALPPRETPLGFVPSRVLREGLDQDSA
jgi:hypothetical protein